MTTPGTDPLVKTDHSKDKGGWLSGGWTDDESVKQGAESARPLLGFLSHSLSAGSSAS